MKTLVSTFVFVIALGLVSETRAADLCDAHGFTGNTVEEAEAACVKLGDYYTRSQCNQDVMCEEGVLVCTSRGYKGSTMTLAIEACYDLGYVYSREQCEQDVSCK